MGIFSFNWQYKIIALLLASVLYMYTSDLITIEKYIVIRNPSQDTEAIASVPDGLVVTSIETTHDIEVRLLGPRAVLEDMEENMSLRLELSEDAIRDNKQVFMLSNRLLGLDPSITITNAHKHKDIVVHVSRIQTKNIQIEPKIIITDYPDYLNEAEITLKISTAEVRGPESLVDRLSVLQVKPISFSIWNLTEADFEGARVENIPVRLELPAGIERTENSFISARILMKPQQDRRDMNLVVGVDASLDFIARYDITMPTPMVTITIHGPVHLLKTLKEEQLTAKVKLDEAMFAEDRSKNGVPIYVDGPSWMSTSATAVRVTTHLRVSETVVLEPVPTQLTNPPRTTNSTTEQTTDAGPQQQPQQPVPNNNNEQQRGHRAHDGSILPPQQQPILPEE